MPENVEEAILFIVKISMGWVKDLEGTRCEWVVPFLLFIRFEPLLAIGTYRNGQVDVKSLYRGRGLTLDNVAHLLRPPGCVLEHLWWNNTAIVDALLVISIFGALGARPVQETQNVVSIHWKYSRQASRHSTITTAVGPLMFRTDPKNRNFSITILWLRSYIHL